MCLPKFLCWKLTPRDSEVERRLGHGAVQRLMLLPGEQVRVPYCRSDKRVSSIPFPSLPLLSLSPSLPSSLPLPRPFGLLPQEDSKKPLIRCNSCILDFPASRTVSHVNFCSLSVTQSEVFCYRSRSRSRT